MVIFNSYVKLPEGKFFESHDLSLVPLEDLESVAVWNAVVFGLAPPLRSIRWGLKAWFQKQRLTQSVILVDIVVCKPMDQALGHLKLQASCRMQGLATSHPWSLNSSVSSVSQPPGERYQRSMLLSSGRRTLLRLRSQRFPPEYCPKISKNGIQFIQSWFTTIKIYITYRTTPSTSSPYFCTSSALHLHFIWSKRFILRPPLRTDNGTVLRLGRWSGALPLKRRIAFLPLPRRSWHGSEIYPPKIKGQTPGMVWTCLEHPGTILNPNFGHFNILQCTE